MIPRRQSRPGINGTVHTLADPEQDVTMDELRGHVLRLHTSSEALLANVAIVSKNVATLMREHRKSSVMQNSGMVGVIGIVADRIVQSASDAAQTHPQNLAVLLAALLAMFFVHRRGAGGALAAREKEKE